MNRIETLAEALEEPARAGSMTLALALLSLALRVKNGSPSSITKATTELEALAKALKVVSPDWSG